ncbi:MAG: transposase, partial [Muribaculaceae bacterium]|nr:transposase [Muribaculaceae bacterium]
VKKQGNGKKGNGQGSPVKNHKKTKCVDIRGILPADFSELPPNFKVIMRKGKADTYEIEILYMDKPKAYSKKFTIARCNIPGEDPGNSKYPPRLFGKVDVDPSFASFVLDMKFGYNIPESRILEMLVKAGCNMPQPTLNRWIHQIIEGLYGTLIPEMEKAIKKSRFTHNDETRILVRSQEKDEEAPSYKTEYIHGILSPEANLFLMLYEKGSRGHQVQKRIFEDSSIIAFLADRCPIYLALMTALDCHPLIRGACWIHFRRYLLHAYLQDKRLEPMVHLLARLFQAERIISGMRDLTETKRVRERERMCRPLVEAMFAFMEKVRASGTDYGVLARRAADYLLDDSDGFHAFLACGLMEIGNNAVERCFRSIAKGRENWLQCGSHEAAKNTAFMYSLVECCKMNELDFGQYIETVLIRIQNGDTDFHSMLPNAIVLPKAGENTGAA